MDIIVKITRRALSSQTTAMQELIIDQDYLATMQIKLEAGRNFQDKIITDQANSVLVNETLVK